MTENNDQSGDAGRHNEAMSEEANLIFALSQEVIRLRAENAMLTQFRDAVVSKAFEFNSDPIVEWALMVTEDIRCKTETT